MMRSLMFVLLIKSRRMGWGGGGVLCDMQWAKGEVYRVLVGKPVRKRPLGRCMCKWKDNITRSLKK
jgi:hypothetical protein